MKMTVDRNDFARAFKDYSREDNFSPRGLDKLFEHLEEYEDSTGEEIELDVIALCCDYSEIELEHLERETGCETIEELRDKTTVIEVDSSTIIYQAF